MAECLTRVAGAIKQSNSVVVMLLMLVTCGIYVLYWLYKTSDELRLTLRDESINPTVDLLLTIVICGLFGMYVEYRNVQKVHAALFPREPTRTDQSQLVLLWVSEL